MAIGALNQDQVWLLSFVVDVDIEYPTLFWNEIIYVCFLDKLIEFVLLI
jgi:hypothetical protein